MKQKETRKVHSTKQMPSLIINNRILKGLENVAEAFNNLFLAVTENLNLNHTGREDTTFF
jgi:hypothetical protein